IFINRMTSITTDNSTSTRLIYYQNAFEKFQESPIIGLGFGAFGPEGYPHNLFLEIMTENGLLLLLFSLFCILLIVKLFFNLLVNRKSVDGVSVVIMALVLLSLGTLMVSWTYIDHKYLYISLGLLIINLRVGGHS